MTKRMIDVSSNNHYDDEPINWAYVAQSGVKAVMIKATQDTDYINPWLSRDAHGANAAGLEVGYYHFAIPYKVDNPQHSEQAQAEYFEKAITGLPRSLGGCLDFEQTNGLDWLSCEAWIKTFLKSLSSDIKQKVLYTNPNYLGNLPGAPYGNLLWLADWRPTPPRINLWAWQSGYGEVPGVIGQCDIDTLYV